MLLRDYKDGQAVDFKNSIAYKVFIEKAPENR